MTRLWSVVLIATICEENRNDLPYGVIADLSACIAGKHRRGTAGQEQTHTDAASYLTLYQLS